MAIEKIDIESAEVKLCLHSGQPDVPKMTAAETKDFFDSMAKKVVIPKVNEIIDELPNKADGSEVYSKDEADALLKAKADADKVYSKTEADTLLSGKADADTVYNKNEVDDLLGGKADADVVYTKDEVDGRLGDKADADAVYNKDSVYTKTETDTLLGEKADADDVYTKSEVDKKISSSGSSGTSGGTSIALSEFVDLFEVCYGSLQNMLDRRVVAFSFHNNEFGTEIFLRKVTDGIEEIISVSVRYDYVVFAYEMGEMIATVKLEPDKAINLYDIFDIVPLRHEFPDDGLYIDSAEMSVYGRVLFDGVTNVSTAATLFKTKSVEAPEIKLATKKAVEIGDDITHLCANEGYPDVEIDVTVTLKCGTVYNDTLKYYVSFDNGMEYRLTSGYYSDIISSSEGETIFNNCDTPKFLYDHYEHYHIDVSSEGCLESVESILVTDVRYGDDKDTDTYIVTKGFLTYDSYLKITQL